MRDMTVLWALRSPCNLGCRYCYFGTIEDHRDSPPDRAGQLSHLARDDASLDDVTRFLADAAGSAIARVFIAGGEPLIWPHIFTVVGLLKDAGVEVVLCTNGIPLLRPEITGQIIRLGVDGVSVSLDSAGPGHNDLYRPARNRKHGHADVLAGVRALLAARGSRAFPKTGLYTAVTRRNIGAVTEVAALAAGLGADYFVPQPISLDPGDALHGELALRDSDLPALAEALTRLYDDPPPVALPDRFYAGQFLSVIEVPLQTAKGCFGGHQLAFIEPDGSVWDCPSRHKIAATAPAQRRTIRGNTAASLFSPGRGTCAADCPLQSADCISMWPLTGFGRFLHPEPR